MGATQRARELSRKLMSSPVLPVLGWTKAVEATVAGGPLLNWIAYAGVVTVVWIFADELQRRADDVADSVD